MNRSPRAGAIVPLLNVSSKFSSTQCPVCAGHGSGGGTPAPTAADGHPPSSAHRATVMRAMRVEVYQLTGLALCGARRFVQAAEMFGRAEACLFESVSCPHVTATDTVPAAGSSARQLSDGDDATYITSALLHAASLCLLAGDGLSHVNQLPDRLVSEPLCARLCRGV